MVANGRAGVFAGLVLLLAGAAGGCAKASTLTVAPGTPEPPQLLPAEQLETSVYKRLLLLPIESEIEIKDTELALLSEKGEAYYTAILEKALLAQEFELISPEIVARVEKGLRGDRLSAAEKALILGKQTKADAVFQVKKLSVRGMTDYFSVEDMKTQPVDPSRVKEDKKGRLYHVESEDCVFALPYYEIRFEGKLIDARNGNVLWVGAGRQTVFDALSESWVAKLDKRCEMQKENFVFADYAAAESTLDATFSGLVDRLVVPMKKAAMAGEPLFAEESTKLKKVSDDMLSGTKSATVSSKYGSLRAGPGKRTQRLRRVSRKTKVEIRETSGEWHKVELQDGTVGWMHDSVVIISE